MHKVDLPSNGSVALSHLCAKAVPYTTAQLSSGYSQEFLEFVVREGAALNERVLMAFFSNVARIASPGILPDLVRTHSLNARG
jgi:hypothetical protein